MKHMKKALSLLLALVMVLGLSSTAWAAGSTDEKGSITITGAYPQEQYKIYRIADLTSYDTDNDRYIYKLCTEWAGLMTWQKDGTNVINGVYLTASSTNDEYITWAKNPYADSDVRAFAKLCKEFADTHHISPTDTKTASGTSEWVNDPDKPGTQIPKRVTVAFSDLPLGYYLVDSSAGLVCSLNTTNPDVDIEEKNIIPTVTKQVQEDSAVGTGNPYGSENDADIGQAITFQSDIKIRDTDNIIFPQIASAN